MEERKVTPEDLALINQFAKRELTADEVYTFSAVAADSQVDRDNEYFPPETLKQLSRLIVGTTIISDHDPKSDNQTARVFRAYTRQTDKGVTQLVVDAYTLRNGSEDFIQRVEAGIVKEVSIACAVKEPLCSVCGKRYGVGGCRHYKGREYDGKPCVVALSGAADVYELSFVAVPAQREAGVIKCRKSFDVSGGQEEAKNDLSKETMTLSEKLRAEENYLKEIEKSWK